jgi:cytochrome d ubiquinol oxidase subunit I
MEPLLAARLQMAITLGFHIIFACFGMGLPVLLLVAEGKFLRTGDEGWRRLARRWSKAFAVLFAVGAVSGTVLSFELGLLWPGFMGTFGPVIGLPFTLEAFAFFLEAIFAGIYLYTWDRLPPRAHWLTGFPIAIAGLASAAFVVTANAWMNCPQGFTLIRGKVAAAEPLRAMLNPASGPQIVHMILAAGLVAGFGIASVYAAGRLRGNDSPHHRRALALGLALGAICAPLQAVAGDWAARVVARTQPVKFAAMEGQFRTEARAPLRIGGIPDPVTETTRFAIEIPGGLSWLAHKDPDAVVEGLDRVWKSDRPPVVIVHLAFQAMVGIGLGLIALSAWAGGALLARRRLPEGRAFLWSVAVAGPLAAVALEAGWVVTEVGRQPWIVQGILRTSDAVTDAPGVAWTFAASLAIYAALTAGTILALRHLAGRQP